MVTHNWERTQNLELPPVSGEFEPHILRPATERWLPKTSSLKTNGAHIHETKQIYSEMRNSS